MILFSPLCQRLRRAKRVNLASPLNPIPPKTPACGTSPCPTSKSVKNTVSLILNQKWVGWYCALLGGRVVLAFLPRELCVITPDGMHRWRFNAEDLAAEYSLPPSARRRFPLCPGGNLRFASVFFCFGLLFLLLVFDTCYFGLAGITSGAFQETRVGFSHRRAFDSLCFEQC